MLVRVFIFLLQRLSCESVRRGDESSRCVCLGHSHSVFARSLFRCWKFGGSSALAGGELCRRFRTTTSPKPTREVRITCARTRAHRIIITNECQLEHAHRSGAAQSRRVSTFAHVGVLLQISFYCPLATFSQHTDHSFIGLPTLLIMERGSRSSSSSTRCPSFA